MPRTTWKFYLTPPEAVKAMYKACEQAQVSIDLEQYIFEDNPQGHWFLSMLMKKAREGVAVRLLADAVGSYTLYTSPILLAAYESGMQVQFFNPIEPWWVHKLFTRFLRTHRKLLIVDNEYGFTGGVGIRMYEEERRDTHVRVRGPVVSEMRAAFNRMWEMTAKGKRSFTFRRPAAVGEFTLLTNSPHFRQRFTYRALVERFRGATQYIYLTTPYFLPDWRLFRALRGAARRGVDVRILVPASPDWKLVRFGNSSFYNRCLKAGIRIFEFGPHFVHAKTCVIDGLWASVGSSNMDNLSLLLNYEADIASTNPQFVADLLGHFQTDLQLCHEVDAHLWRERPWWHKLLEQLIRPLHRFM